MRLFMAGAVALSLTSGVAFAQSASETTTTQETSPAPMAPAPGTLSETKTHHSDDGYGDTHDSKSTTYQNGAGVASESESTTTTAAPPPPPPTTSTTTTTSQTTAPQ